MLWCTTTDYFTIKYISTCFQSENCPETTQSKSPPKSISIKYFDLKIFVLSEPGLVWGTTKLELIEMSCFELPSLVNIGHLSVRYCFQSFISEIKTSNNHVKTITAWPMSGVSRWPIPKFGFMTSLVIIAGQSQINLKCPWKSGKRRSHQLCCFKSPPWMYL